MSKKKKYVLTAAVVIANLLIIFIVKDWENLRKGRIIAPYRQPTKSEVTRWAAEIERRLNEEDIDFVIDRYDGNAGLFFGMGVTNWASERGEIFKKELMRSSLAGIKGCRLKVCDVGVGQYSPNRLIVYELVYEDGSKADASAEFFKNRRGGLGVANFIVLLPKEFIETISDQIVEKNGWPKLDSPVVPQ
ncbi:MAG: hypothetical protein IKE64_10695 [Thermoguttaceae bacterium]|nr:hypothetical protein [Thermoguttaceae bacterium]